MRAEKSENWQIVRRFGYTLVLEFMGLLGGTLSGLFVLGIFSRRASGKGALIGAVLSAVIVFTVRLTNPLNVYAYAPIGLISCVGVGWLISLAAPASPRSLDGLIFRRVRERPH